MEAQENNMPVNIDVAVTKPVTREFVHLNSEVSDIVGVDAALDEAMELEDAEVVKGSTEKSFQSNASQDKTEEANKGEEKSKDIGCFLVTELPSASNPVEVITVAVSDKETDTSEVKIFGDDNTAIYEDIQGGTVDLSLLVPKKRSRTGNSNPVISQGTTDSQEEHVAGELLHETSEVGDKVAAEAVGEEAELKDTEEISSAEKSSRTEAHEKVGKSKDIASSGGAELISLNISSGAVTEEKSDKERDKFNVENLGDDKTVRNEDKQGERLNASLLVEEIDSKVRSSNLVIAKRAVSEGSREEPKIPHQTDQKESVVLTKATTAIGEDVAEEVAVEAVEDTPVSQDPENEGKHDMGDSLPAAAVNGEKRILVESRGKPKAPARPVKVDPPTVQPSTSKQTLKAEAEPSGKPCDRITKEMVPTMSEGRIEEVVQLSTQIEFHKRVTPLALLSKSRWLVAQVDVTLVSQSNSAFSIFRSLRKTTYHLFLFNDTFVICKKKGTKFMALNYCQRYLVLITKASSVQKLPEKVRTDTKGKNKVYLTMLENHEKKEESIVLSFSECKDRDDWIKFFKTPALSSQQETVFELWDCPLVKVIHDFDATKPEEMTVRKDEKINVIRKGADGFYEGERIRDQMRGYFPISAAVELASEHSRALQIRNRHNDTTF